MRGAPAAGATRPMPGVGEDSHEVGGLAHPSRSTSEILGEAVEFIAGDR
ncbi:hypothetical protein [Nocardia asiatica]|nr:hypothetical protein [Nocardia asiatica]